MDRKILFLSLISNIILIFSTCSTQQGVKTNLINNSSFELWSKGKNSDPDNWSREYGFGIVERESIIRKSGNYSAKYIRVGKNINAYQRIPNYSDLKGKGLICSIWVFAPKLNRESVRIIISDGREISYSSWYSGSGSWEKLKVIHIMDNNPTELKVIIDGACNVGSEREAKELCSEPFTFYVDDLNLTENSVSIHVLMTRMISILMNMLKNIYIKITIIILILIATSLCWYYFE